MALLVDCQEVPWRILELVKARILANRKRLADRERAEGVRGLTRPRPQRKAFGATMSTYRRPEPVGLFEDDTIGIGYAQVLGITTTTGTWDTGITWGGKHVVYSGDGTKSVELVHEPITGDPVSWPGDAGAPGYKTKFTGYTYEQWPLASYGDSPQGGYLYRMTISQQWEESGGLYIPPGIPYVDTTLEEFAFSLGSAQGAPNVFVFPAGGGNSLVVCCLSYAWAITERRTSIEYWQVPPPVPGVSSPNRRNSWVEASGKGSGSSYSIRCAIAGKSAVREVPTPAALADALKRVVGVKLNPTQTYAERLSEFGTYQDPGTGETVVLPGSVYDTSYPLLNYPLPYFLGGFQGEVQLSHGIQQILDGVYDYRIVGGSPSAFYYLGVTDPENGYAEQTDVSPAAWDQTLRTAAGKIPKIAVPTTEDAPYEVRLYSGVLPAERYGGIPDGATGIGRRISTFTPAEEVQEPPYVEGQQSSAYLLRTTDWGQPSYCKAQLKALGFTDADLKP